ncbi:MAG: hypothetical protein IPH91_03995 [Elusimicrobia bacterium]|nr:hypothetical protein [Elusimicrobiota bacterium]MBP8004506.1 hypothetical protein [Elusimicrobiota bacterium]
MKKLFAFGTAALVAGFVTTARAETVVAVNTVDAVATVSVVDDLYTDVMIMSNNNLTAVRTLNFGTINGTPALWSNKPLQAVKIKVDDNAPSWRLRTYTDNFPATTPTTTTWGWNFGGMKAGDGNKAAMGWMILPDTGTHAGGGPGTGDPQFGSIKSTTTGLITGGNGWTYLKDFKDYNDPSNDVIVDGKNTKDESFTGSDAGGYCNIAFGNPSSTTIVRPNVNPGNEALLGGRLADFYYYAEANFNGSAGGDYATTVKFDLINE